MSATKEFQFIQGSLQRASAYAAGKFGNDFTSKPKTGKTDLVTETDLAIHELVVKEIHQQFNGHRIISEEAIDNHHEIDSKEIFNGPCWFLDPIDGTNNFAFSIPLFGVMLAYAEDGVLLASGVILPLQKELYMAQRGQGASRNGETIQCRQEITWEHTFGCTNASLSPEKADLRAAINKAADAEKFWLNAYGSAAMSGCYVASGKRDWYMTKGSMIWDYAPIALILEESGCKVTNFSGEPWSLNHREMLAANPTLHASLQKLLN